MCLEEGQAAHRSVNKEIAEVNFRLVGLTRNKSKMKRPSLNVWYLRREIWNCQMKKRENAKKRPFRRRILAKSY